MKRRWIPLKDLEIFDEMHYQTDTGWAVNEEKDGQTYEEHRKGIEYIKELIAEGAKIRPILAVEHDENYFVRLDGFKRCIAHIEAGERFVEAFVFTDDEVREKKEFPYLHGTIWAGKGGQMKEVYSSVVEGYDQEGVFDYKDQKFLYKDDNKPHGLRIEVSESIHCHWGEYGRYRLGLGRRDFEQLAEAIASIE